MKDRIFSKVNWNTQRSGIEIKTEIFKELEAIWKEPSKQNDFSIPEEIEETNLQKIFEGAKKTIQVNSYERNPVARRICIERYGTKCSVCNFDFNESYGEKIAENYIHVHHLKQLSTISEKYEVNPIKDLRPVCPNCHAMIHKRNPPYSIEEIKTFIENQTK